MVHNLRNKTWREKAIEGDITLVADVRKLGALPTKLHWAKIMATEALRRGWSQHAGRI